ncbi:uncharacterized protein LOC103513171 [Diaphorina citri]|uniref:Uncharacterized protein LOC103513171 n=1 Tax=Diaphorina citri TaxID=121845 RepID=A0A1S3D7R4_DIACI|nr:uncharacterized protein LOC103513171 [Diaphorina citri]XP_026682245.1 uncharacterized protein LOC103513171 [Diaphorina citri]XP_026682246.1 uncharacterized protein LOC103513171 [Diaphorina citri]XP_026682247.1 uncharacterized protein LOC103513171 [Diaphorina citri]
MSYYPTSSTSTRSDSPSSDFDSVSDEDYELTPAEYHGLNRLRCVWPGCDVVRPRVYCRGSHHVMCGEHAWRAACARCGSSTRQFTEGRMAVLRAFCRMMRSVNALDPWGRVTARPVEGA